MRVSTQAEACLGDRRWEQYKNDPAFFEREWNRELPPFASPYWKIVTAYDEGKRVINYMYLFSDGQKETWACLNSWTEGIPLR